MAKRANKVQEQEMDIATMGQIEMAGPQVPTATEQVAETGPELDANGRKKRVDLSHEELEAKGLKNKSQVIRYLDSEGYGRAGIALFLNIRYQHVRNVLVTPLKKV